MEDKLYLNNEVSKIVGVTQRQILSWTEKGLVHPEMPAKKAGARRGYSYKNLLEFGLAKYLLDVIGLQFYSAKKILDDFREDGDFKCWASNYFNFLISIARKYRYSKDDDSSGSHIRFRLNDPRGRGGTVDVIDNSDEKLPTPEKQDGTLYYIFTKLDFPKESIKIVNPWDITRILEAFEYEGLEDILSHRGIIIVNLRAIKEEIDEGIKRIT